MKLKKVVAYIFVALLFAHTIGQIRTLRIWRQKQKQIEELEIEIARVEEENRVLQMELGRVKTNQAVEQAIRDKLSWSKPGEQVVVLGERKKMTKVQNRSDEDGKIGWWGRMGSNISRWFEVFGW